MSWIAKNDITGKTYGKKFNNIYDCQKYIDTHLLKLQFLYAMIVGLEKDISNEDEFQKWFAETYKGSNQNSVLLEVTARIQFGIKDLFDGLPKNPRNNVIRCYNVEQKRYADGFDF